MTFWFIGLSMRNHWTTLVELHCAFKWRKIILFFSIFYLLLLLEANIALRPKQILKNFWMKIYSFFYFHWVTEKLRYSFFAFIPLYYHMSILPGSQSPMLCSTHLLGILSPPHSPVLHFLPPYHVSYHIKTAFLLVMAFQILRYRNGDKLWKC